MEKTLLSVLKSAIIIIICLVTIHLKGEVLHWFEAENFKGNASVINDKTCSAGKCLKGKTWFCFTNKIPFPKNGKKDLNCWLRLKSDVPAVWYLWDSKTKKVKCWLKTPKADIWQWIKAGSYSSDTLASNNNYLWNLFLRKPINHQIPTATGYLDVVVISDINDPEHLNSLFKEKIAPKKIKVTQKQKFELEKLKDIRRITECPFFEKNPIIDGKLNDKCWTQAAPLKDFMLLYGKGLAQEQTEVKIGYDKNNLYVAAILKESKIKFLRKLQTIRNDNVWSDDCFELFLDPGLTQKQATHFIVNPLGTMGDNLSQKIDEINFGKKTSRDWKAKTTIEKDRWTVEMAIPWSLIARRSPQNGEAWGFNACRAERPHNETSYWNNTGGYFYRPADLGIILFGKFPVTLNGIKIKPEEEKVTFQVSSKGVSNAKLETKLLKDKKVTSVKSSAILSSGKQTITQPLTLKTNGLYELSVNLLIKEKNKIKFILPFKTYSEGLISVAWPAEERDNVLYLLGNTVQHCFFLFANHSDKPISKPVFEVIAPEGVNILSPADSLNTYNWRYFPAEAPLITRLTIKGHKYLKYTYKIKRPIAPGRIEKKRFFDSLKLFFEVTNKNLYGKSIPVYYALKSGKLIEEQKSFSLKILPPLKGKQPKNIIIQNWLWTLNPGPENWKQYAKTLATVGFNSVDAAIVKDKANYLEDLKKYKIISYNNLWWHWQYPKFTQKNPNATAVSYEGKRHSKQVCPTILLEKDGKILLEAFKPQLKLIQDRLADGYIWDLEGPYCWEVCFCKHCLKAFKRFASIPKSENLTPKIIKQKYAKQWIAFCCSQSAGICKILRTKIKKLNPNAGFGFYSATPSFTTCEKYRIDWTTAAPYIDWALPSYYSASPADLNVNFTSGMKKVIRTIRNAAKHPIKVIATLTPGYGRNSTVNPSAGLVKMHVLRSICSGMDGVSFWWWGPFDGLYYKKLAEATNIITDFEKFFLNGKRTSKVKLINPYGNTVSSFIREQNGLILAIIFNHNPQEKRKISLIIQENFKGYEYPNSNRVNQSITIPPLEAIAILFGKNNTALEKIKSIK